MPALAKTKQGLSTNALKIIACVTMLLDHIGAYLIVIPESVSAERFLLLNGLYLVLRTIGRLSFPIFAFCIALGCRYTHNKLLHFLTVFGLGAAYEAVYFLVEGKLEGNILITFSCSILIIYAVQFTKWAMAHKKTLFIVLGFALFIASLGVGYGVNRLFVVLKDMLGGTGGVQYGVFGIAVPVFACLVDYDKDKSPLFLRRLDKNALRVFLLAIGIFIHWWMTSGDLIQAAAFLAVIPLSFYNGQPGSKKFKWGFYIFYPAHLALIWLVGGLIYGF